MIKLIPAIDILDQKLVRLRQGDYNQATVYNKSPIEMAHFYKEIGVKWIHVVDLNGAKEGDLVNLETIESIAKIKDLSIQVGGGVRTKAHVTRLINAGASAIIIGSLFVHDFNLSVTLAHEFPKKIIAGLDVLNGNLATNGWINASQIRIEAMVKRLSTLPLHGIISTDISKDGTFCGLNLDLYKLLSQVSTHPIIASGGVSSIDDIKQLLALNSPIIEGCIVGKAIIEKKISPTEFSLYV